MTIVGHGIDLVEVAKMRRWVEDSRNPLLPRCFVRSELDEVGDGVNRIERLAGRFAAKEAVLKAIGVGIGSGVALTDVVICHVPGVAPTVRLSGGAATAALGLGITTWKLSISHAGGMALASALALSEKNRDNASCLGARRNK